MRHFKKRRFAGNKKKKSNLDYRLLTKSASNEQEQKYEAKIAFSEMELNSILKSNILKKGFSKPTEIQEATYNFVKQGKDVVGIANTGTGKTAAFLIPVIEKMIANKKGNLSLVIVPTRELANQVELEFKTLTKGLNLNSGCLIGGGSVSKDIQFAKGKKDIIIGTPGRIIDLINRRALNLSSVQTLILDEFDRMLDMGFINDVRKIVSEVKQRNQTLLYSATKDKSQDKLISEIAVNAELIEVSSGATANKNIDQNIIKIDHTEEKFNVFMDLISKPNFDKVIVFAETKRLVDKLAKKLNNSGITAGIIHGDKTQSFRNKAIKQFKTGRSKILIATDVVARGIDIDDITHVINYQLPQTMDSYLHRIGRTGRAGKKGVAYTFVDL